MTGATSTGIKAPTVDVVLLPPRGQGDWELLSEDERSRAGTLGNVDVRERYVHARAGLRRVLAAATGRPAENLEFTYGPHGKPALADGGLRFSVAHDGPMAVVVLGDVEVGVDAQRRVTRDVSRIVRRFSPAEQAQIEDSADPAEEFTIRWVCKEAVLKAIGSGLSVPLSNVEVTRQNGRLVVDASAIDDRPWSVVVGRLASGHYVGVAIAADRPVVRWRSRPAA